MNNDLRIEHHPILEFKRGKRITFQFEGKQVVAYENESIAAALFASGVKVLSRSKRFRALHRPVSRLKPEMDPGRNSPQENPLYIG